MGKATIPLPEGKYKENIVETKPMKLIGLISTQGGKKMIKKFIYRVIDQFLKNLRGGKLRWS